MYERSNSLTASDMQRRRSDSNGLSVSVATTRSTEVGGQLGLSVPEPLVLIVDDDPAIAKLISHNLELAGYRVIKAGDGTEALRAIRQECPDLVLLDVLLPGMDGFRVCEEVREFSDVPIIMTTVKGALEDIVRGLDIGADDYVVKPFDVKLLVARARAVLSRTRVVSKLQRPPLLLGRLRIDASNHKVSLAGREVLLTHTEYKILFLLARNVGRMVTKEYILTEVWGPEYSGDDHVLQVTVARLRKKMGDCQRNPRYIVTKTGVGYMLRKPEEQEDIPGGVLGTRPQARDAMSVLR
jgi:DNA-binding response OmpR family regulator